MARVVFRRGGGMGMAAEDVAAGGGRVGAPLSPCDAPARRWRDLVGDGLLLAALLATFPGSVLTYIGAGQTAAVSVVAAALVLMLAGWVVGRGKE